MVSVADLATTLQPLLTTVADQAARDSGFIRRVRTFTGAAFVQALVFGWLGNPDASFSGLTQTAAACDAPLSRQGLVQRFTPQAADCLRRVLDTAVRTVVAADALALPILTRFCGVYLWDSTTITLPDALAPLWSGCGGRVATHTCAALKVQLRWEFTTGAFDWLTRTDGRTSDRAAAADAPPLPAGALRLADRGYFSLTLLPLLTAQRVFLLCRFPAQPLVFVGTQPGKAVGDLLATVRGERVDMTVTLGTTARVPCRLLAIRVDAATAAQRRRRWRKEAKREGHTIRASRLARAEWDAWLTTVPPDHLTLDEAQVLIGLRWQIELLFKQWKSGGRVDCSRSAQPYRVLTEVYAKLVAMLVAHWCLLLRGGDDPRRSRVKAAAMVRQHAFALLLACRWWERLVTALHTLATCLASAGQVGKRRTRPATADQLLALPLLQCLN
ncbi:MAG: IS4 family transposase [Thermomicrobiales bacterium]